MSECRHKDKYFYPIPYLLFLWPLLFLKSIARAAPRLLENLKLNLQWGTFAAFRNIHLR
jgi:hypothetical protein